MVRWSDVQRAGEYHVSPVSPVSKSENSVKPAGQKCRTIVKGLADNVLIEFDGRVTENVKRRK